MNESRWSPARELAYVTEIERTARGQFLEMRIKVDHGFPVDNLELQAFARDYVQLLFELALVHLDLSQDPRYDLRGNLIADANTATHPAAHLASLSSRELWNTAVDAHTFAAQRDWSGIFADLGLKLGTLVRTGKAR